MQNNGDYNGLSPPGYEPPDPIDTRLEMDHVARPAVERALLRAWLIYFDTPNRKNVIEAIAALLDPGLWQAPISEYDRVRLAAVIAAARPSILQHVYSLRSAEELDRLEPYCAISQRKDRSRDTRTAHTVDEILRGAAA